MNNHQPSTYKAKEVNILRQQFPDHTILHGSDGDLTGTPYRIIHEVEVNGEHYALLQKADDHPDDLYLFHVNQGRLEEIEDETEWENIADAVDEMLYFHDFQ